MPAEFQNAIDLTITNCENTFAYLDDILIVAKCSKEDHREHVHKVLTKLNDKNLAITIEKGKFACEQVEWLRYSMKSEVTKLLNQKTDVIAKLTQPKTFKQLKQIYGFITSPDRIKTEHGKRGFSTPTLIKNTD